MTQSSSEIFEPISIKRFSKIRNRGSARWNPWISFSLSRENRVCFIQNRLDFEQICIFYNFGRFRVGKSWPRFRSTNQLAPGDNQLMVSIRFELNHGGWSFLTKVIMLIFNFAYKKLISSWNHVFPTVSWSDHVNYSWFWLSVKCIKCSFPIATAKVTSSLLK